MYVFYFISHCIFTAQGPVEDQSLTEQATLINKSIHNVAGADKTWYIKNFKCSGEPKKHGCFNTIMNGTAFLFTMPQWLYPFRLKSAIWTGQNLVS